MVAYCVLLIWIGCLCAALARPHVGAIATFGFALLDPAWNWRWVFAQDFPFQQPLVAATLIGMAVNGFRVNRLRGANAIAAWSLISVVGIGWISHLQSIDPELSGWCMSIFWKVVVVVILIMLLVDTPKRVVTMMWVMVLAQGYNALQINIYYFQDGFCRFIGTTSWGTSGDNNLYSNITVAVLSISFALAFYSKNWMAKSLAIGIALLQLHQLMLLESRGAMLGAIVMLAVLIYFMPKNRTTVLVAVLAACVGVVLAGPPVIKEFSSIFRSEGQRDASADSRYHLWAAGWAITKDYPLLGLGPYASSRIVPQYYFESEQQTRRSLHNLAFEVSTGFGIPATVLFLSFFGFVWWPSVRLMRNAETRPPPWANCALLGSVAGVAGYWVASMFSSGLLLESSYFLTATGAVTLHILQRDGYGDDYHDEEGPDEADQGRFSDDTYRQRQKI